MKRTVDFLKVVAVLALLLAVTTTVYAAATFGGSTGPAFLNPGYRFTAQVTALSNPHGNVCLSYTINGVAQPAINCTCTAPDCNTATNLGQWVCTIPANINSASITWDISAYPGNSCSGNKAQGPTGSFTTGPNALKLATLAAQEAPASSYAAIALLIVVGVIAVGAVLTMLRRRTAA
jgi:hypothetical protein